MINEREAEVLPVWMLKTPNSVWIDGLGLCVGGGWGQGATWGHGHAGWGRGGG